MTLLDDAVVARNIIVAEADKLVAMVDSLEGDLPPDPPPVVVPTFSLVSSAPTILENAGLAHFRGVLSEPTTAVASVRVRHQNGSAAAGSDFLAVDSVLIFDPGEVEILISVQIINDTAVEVDESFSLVASEPIGCTISVGSASVTIKSDDVEPTPIPPPIEAPIDEIPPIASGDVARYAGTTYPTLLAAINAAAAGGTIEILPGRHVGQKAFVGNFKKKLKIKGILDSQRRRPFLDGTNISIPNGMLTPNADLTCEYLGFTNMHNNNNAAGIWTNVELMMLIVRWCMFKKMDNGILGSIGNAFQKHLVEDSYFIDGGYGATARGHNMYFGAGEETKLVRVRSHLPFNGMCGKTRARRAILEDCDFRQGNAGNYAWDLPNGGFMHIYGTAPGKSYFYKPPGSGNQTLIQMNGDISNPNNQVPDGGVTRVHNTLIENTTLENLRVPGVWVNNSLNPQGPVVVRACKLLGNCTMAGPVTIES